MFTLNHKLCINNYKVFNIYIKYNVIDENHTFRDFLIVHGNSLWYVTNIALDNDLKVTYYKANS